MNKINGFASRLLSLSESSELEMEFIVFGFDFKAKLNIVNHMNKDWNEDLFLATGIKVNHPTP